MVSAFVWVFGGLLVTVIGAYWLNSLGFRDYIDGIITALKTGGPNPAFGYALAWAPGIYESETDVALNSQ